MDVRDPVPGVSVYGLTNQANALTQLSVVPCWYRKLGIIASCLYEETLLGLDFICNHLTRLVHWTVGL